MIWVYRIIFYPLIWIGLRTLSFFNAKIAAGFRERQKRNGIEPWLTKKLTPSPIWIHCASGEYEYAKPVIRKLKEQLPQVPILVTYFSPSVRPALEKDRLLDFIAPLPWDSPRDLKKFLTHHQPRAALIARTDTWPEMLFQLKKAQVPCLLFAATFTEQAGRNRIFIRSFTRYMLNLLSTIHCVTDTDKNVLQNLGVICEIQTVGDTRFDQVQFRLQNAKPLKNLFFDRGKTFVAGSTWSEDEQELLPMIQALQEKLHFVICPHEPTPSHLSSLEEKFLSLGIRCERYSRIERWSEGTVLLIDQVGILAELYQKADFAFVGGSFRKTVHSVMEPLASGCVTFVGPLFHNNREAQIFSQINVGQRRALCAVEPVRDSQDWTRRLKEILILEHDWVSMIQEEVASRRGASEAVLTWIKNKVPHLSSQNSL